MGDNRDDSFQTNSSVQIYDSGCGDGSHEAQLVGRALVQDSTFERIAWGSKGIADQTHDLGMIAGGMSDGAILLWDAQKIMQCVNWNFCEPVIQLFNRLHRNEPQDHIALRKHQASITGLEFHPTEQNLLASGSINSEVGRMLDA